MDVQLSQSIKDGWDYFNIICTAFCGITSLIIVYLCSSMLAEKQKKYEKEFNSLNYLTICANRYLKYMFGIWYILKVKRQCMQDYVNNPEDKLAFFKAFQIIRPPITNFDICLPDYAFTVKKHPKLLDYLLKYTEKYNESMDSINFFNREIDIVLHNNIPEEAIINTVKSHLENNMQNSNLYRWEMSICFTIYNLYCLLQEIHKYLQANKFKDYVWIDIQGEPMRLIQEAEALLDASMQNPNWRNDLIDPHDVIVKQNPFIKFIQGIFSIKNIDNHKVIQIFWIRIKFKLQKKIEENNANQSLTLKKIELDLLNTILNMMSPINSASHNIWCKLEEILKELKKTNDNQNDGNEN